MSSHIDGERPASRFGNLLEDLAAWLLFALLIAAVASAMAAATCFLVAHAPWAFPLMVVALALWCRTDR